MRRVVAVLHFAGLLAVPAYAQPNEFSDDFTAAATYDSASFLGPCYGGTISTKYTVFELQLGDIFNERAVSGGGRLSVDNRGLGSTAPIGFRIEASVIGALNIGQGCSDVAGIPHNQSTENFTSSQLCIYGGNLFSYWQCRSDRDPLGYPDLDGVDNLGGAVNFDDDDDGTTDEFDESLAIVAVTGNNGYGPPFPGGPDGAPGVAGIDDDGNGLTDDVGETAWAGSDDGDDRQGYATWHAGMRIDLGTTSAIYLEIQPRKDAVDWQFGILELIQLQPTPIDMANEISADFFQPDIPYGYAFCASGTCYGAVLWVQADITNPVEVLGPVPSTGHDGALVGLLNENGGTNITPRVGAYLRQNAWIGNPNFGSTFWIISGDPLQYPYFPSLSEDLDGDRDVDGNDFLTFSLCYNGSLRPPQSGCANLGADLDGDGDVDGFDFTTWALCHNGSLKRPQASCMAPVLTACP